MRAIMKSKNSRIESVTDNIFKKVQEHIRDHKKISLLRYKSIQIAEIFYEFSDDYVGIEPSLNESLIESLNQNNERYTHWFGDYYNDLYTVRSLIRTGVKAYLDNRTESTHEEE